MQSNSSCSACSREAEHCCLCLSARTYLCKVCLPHHTSKTGVLHLVASSSLPLYVDKTNLDDYFRRVASVRKLRENAELASTCLTEEWGKLDQALIAFHKEMKKRLHLVCYEVYTEIAAHYESLKGELETFKQELNREEEGIPMNQTSKLYVKKGFHVPQTCSFIDVEREIRRRVVVYSEPAQPLSLQQVIEGWSETPCECLDCSKAREMFRETEESSYWPCESCYFAQNPGNSSICINCKIDWSVPEYSPPTQIEYSPPAQVEDSTPVQPTYTATVQEKHSSPAPPEHTSATYWTCTGCNYAQNPIGIGTCLSCRVTSAAAQLQWIPPESRYYKTVQETTSKSASLPLIGNPSPPLLNIPRGSTWNCQKCKETNSSLNRKCQHCKWLPKESPDVALCKSCGKNCGGKCQSRQSFGPKERRQDAKQTQSSSGKTASRPNTPSKK